ncbi:hypothetical protein AtEden1_Chr5g0113701 [Arabidopsis thaliana]
MTFEVSNNNGDYKGTTHPYKINFMYTMCMKPSEHIPDISRFNFSHFSEILTQSNVDETFIGRFYFNNILHVNMSRFNFSPFSKILTQSDVDEAFIDVSGEIIGMSEIIVKDCSDNMSKLLDIQLRDLSQTITECTLRMPDSESNDALRVSQLMTPELSQKEKDYFPLGRWKSIDHITTNFEVLVFLLNSILYKVVPGIHNLPSLFTST